MMSYKLTEKELTTRLLHDYLTYYKLIAGLDDLGLNGNTYDIRLGDTIFELLGFEESKEEKIYERFFNYSQKVKTINLKHKPEELDLLVNQIYEWLMAEKELNGKKK